MLKTYLPKDSDKWEDPGQLFFIYIFVDSVIVIQWRAESFSFFFGGGFRKIVDLLFLLSQIDLIRRSLKHIKQYLLQFLLKKTFKKCLSYNFHI